MWFGWDVKYNIAKTMGNAMADSEELEIEVPEEDAELPIEIPVSKRKIFTDLADPQIDGLLGKFKRGKLVVQPDFQRHYVWDQVKASNLIESALLSIPIPIVCPYYGANATRSESGPRLNLVHNRYPCNFLHFA